MSTLPTAYTPLESLLLFQALRVNGVDPSAFSRISADLQKIPLVINDPSYDPARLAPEALRHLYLDLLKEEARRDLDQHLAADTNGHVSPNTRKRKAPSPKLPTVAEAAQHSHLIPQLLTRLYVRYRDITVASIRQNEKKHAALSDHAAREVPSSSGSAAADIAARPTAKRLSQARIDDMLNRGPSSTAKDNAAHRRSSSGNSMPTLADLTAAPSQVNDTKFSAPSSYQHAHPPGAHGSPHPSQQMRDLTPRASPRPVVLPPPPASPTLVTQYQSRQQQPSAYSQPVYAAAPVQQQYYGQDQRTPYQSQPVYQPNARGGVMLPPFQLAPHDPAKYHSYQQQPPYPRHDQQYSPTYNYSAPSTAPRPQHPARTGQHPLSGLVAALATPPRQSRPTVWKSETRPPPLSAPGSPKRPDVEPLSPLLARAPSPTAIGKRTRGTRRQTSQLDTKRDLRSASVESSLQDSDTGRRKIKPEPSLVRDSEERDESIPVGATIRTRRGTLQSSLQPGVKRQRQVSTQRSRFDDDDQPTPRSNVVTATRNFGRLSSVIMNEVISHKHGSRFAQPVRDSHADGYSTFIKRPQDLKSIRAAITHGTKAIAAATADMPTATNAAASAKTGGESTVELERSLDLIPPKAIVNGAQLEKEIMRMFANACLFNPGEDGMVADAREMFEDVEGKIAEWRGAERDMPADDEDEARAKRRKL